MTRISRRQFARSVGVAAGAALLPRARGDEKPKTPASAPPPPPSSPPKLSTASQVEAEARVHTIVARYGARLSPAERADLLRLSEEAQQQLDKLRAYPLEDGDEPAHLFRAPRKRR